MGETSSTRTKESMLDLMIQLNKKSRGDKEMKDVAVTLFENSVKVGNKIFLSIPLGSLRVDHRMYQRPLQRHVRMIAKNWKDDKCDALLVNYRGDGYFYIIDGQHRYEAALMRGAKNLVCVVLVGLTIKEEADLFVEQNDDTKKLTPYDTFKANLCRGEERDILINEICKDYGIRVEKSNQIRTLRSVTAARKIVRRNDDGTLNGDSLRWVLQVLKDAGWDNFKGTYNSSIFYSLDVVRTKYNKTLKNAQNKLVDFMKTSTPKEMLALSNSEYPGYGSDCVRLQMLFDEIIEAPVGKGKKGKAA